MYCLISPFSFSMPPFCHEEYGSAKYTFTPSPLLIISWHANSVPLSVVIDLICSLNGLSRCITVRANSFAFFPLGSFLMNSMLVLRSISVTIAPWLPLPTIVSISKSPKRLPSASCGRSLMLVRLGMDMRFPPTGLARCFSLCRQCLYRLPPSALSLRIIR